MAYLPWVNSFIVLTNGVADMIVIEVAYPESFMYFSLFLSNPYNYIGLSIHFKMDKNLLNRSTPKN